jgi:cytochrome c biogenesis protein CcdA
MNPILISKEATMQPEVRKRSILGILSFIIGIVVFLSLCLILIYAIGGTPNERYDYLAETFSILVGLLSIVGVITGIVGSAQKERKKLLAIIGLILNVLVLLFVIWGWISVALGM